MFFRISPDLILNVDTIRSINVRDASDGTGKWIIEILYSGSASFTMRKQNEEIAKEDYNKIVEKISNNRSIVDV